jgi:DUF4097 and DUF4098 domain-containing protein YvlB
MAILSIVTIAAIIWGSAVHLFGVRSNVSRSVFSIPDIVFGKEDGEETKSADAVGKFQNLDVEVQVGKVSIVEGSEYSVNFEGRERLKPVITREGDVLKIRQKESRTVINLGGRQADLTITVPRGETLKNCRVSADAGNLKIDGLEIDDLDTQTDAGNVKISGCRLGEVSMEADLGNIHMQDSAFESLQAELDMGNAKIQSTRDLADAELHLKTEMGTIHVNEKKVGTDYNKSGSEKERVNISSDMGNIRLNW